MKTTKKGWNGEKMDIRRMSFLKWCLMFNASEEWRKEWKNNDERINFWGNKKSHLVESHFETSFFGRKIFREAFIWLQKTLEDLKKLQNLLENLRILKSSIRGLKCRLLTIWLPYLERLSLDWTEFNWLS